jgi:hypothetical protein
MSRADGVLDENMASLHHHHHHHHHARQAELPSDLASSRERFDCAGRAFADTLAEQEKQL